MKVLLIDDEAPVRENMKALLQRHVPEVVVAGEAEGVLSGLELLQKEEPDLVLLDVEMKDGTGFDLLSRCEDPRFSVIFVTGHDRYAIKAFRYSALDYLLKPVAPDELVQAISKVKAAPWEQQAPKLTNLVDNNSKQPSEKKVVLKDVDAVHLVAVKDIVRCEADNNYTLFYLSDGRKLLISRTLREYERLFDDQNFYRTHQSHLINMSFFSRYSKREGGTILMQDESAVPLATRKREAFLAMLDRL